MEIKKILGFLSPFAILLVIIVERRLSLLKNEGSVVMKRLAARLLSLMAVFGRNGECHCGQSRHPTGYYSGNADENTLQSCVPLPRKN